MKPHFKRMTLALVLIALGLFLASRAHAECGSLQLIKPHASLKPQAWDGQNKDGFSSAALLLIHDSGSDADAIVGMWHVKFTAKGNTGTGAPPDGAPIDNALVIWHSDGTEIMTSARPPQDGNICLGVWEMTGRSRYKLNHLPWLNNDTTNAPSGIGNPTGPTRIVEDVVLSRDGNCYTGTFTLDAYDTSGNNTAHIIGEISATRVTISTSVSDLL
jgi:hypothetical protein